jgi:YegS/Rv2252/BmrU family lipid kinase
MHSAEPVASPPPSAALHAAAPFRRALIVANPTAGRGRAVKAARELASGLDALGVAAEVHLTRGRGDGRDRVRALEAGTDLVIAVGGDGTLREVFDGLPDPALPVALLPMGTANVLSIQLKLPRDVDGLLETVRGRRLQRIDVAEVDGGLSFLVTGIGFDGRVIRELEARRQGSITKLSYLPAVLRALRGYRPPALTVEIDGERLPETYGLVLVSNIIHYGGLLKLRNAALDDGHFEVFLFRRASLPALALVALRGIVSSIRDGRGCRVLPARRVRVESPEPVPYQVDGDYRGTTPIELHLTGRRHLLLVP